MSDSAHRPISDEEWDDLVCRLHHQPKPRPRPYFYGRVRARLAADATAKSQTVPGWLRRPAYAVLIGALVMSLSGDGPALRPAAEVGHCEACPGSQLPRLLPR